MKILAIDTSCDETSAAVTEGTQILSNVLWSQASLHTKWGGVYPSLAQRAHQERIDYIIEKALSSAFPKKLFPDSYFLIPKYIDAIAVTAGPGLAIALGVGINKAKDLAIKYKKPLIAVNHVEGHLLSPLAKPGGISNLHTPITFPALSLVASGKHTDLIYVINIGEYKIIAHTVDDALGEALDKAARMLDLGYPGGAILEKFAKEGNSNLYPLPIPMLGKEDRFEFSYSGLKTAMWKIVEKEKPLTKSKIQNLAASFQDKAFLHVERLVAKALEQYEVKSFIFGGGVSSNINLRNRLRRIVKNFDVKFFIPYTKKLCTDNAAMIGVAAYFKAQKNKFEKNIDLVDREANAKIDKQFKWE